MTVKTFDTIPEQLAFTAGLAAAEQAYRDAVRALPCQTAATSLGGFAPVDGQVAVHLAFTPLQGADPARTTLAGMVGKFGKPKVTKAKGYPGGRYYVWSNGPHTYRALVWDVALTRREKRLLGV